MHDDYAVTLNNINVGYGNEAVLTDFSLKVRRGEFVCVVGSSGAGKSTLLKVIANIISFKGDRQVREPMAIQFQNPAIFPWMTVSRNIRLVSVAEAERRDEHVADLLSKVDLSEKAKKFPGELSGGQLQRVALARCLASEPAVLLMDEPYAALDPQLRRSMCGLLENIWLSSGMTVVLVTHHTEDALKLASRIIVLRKDSASVEFPVFNPRPRTYNNFSSVNPELESELLGTF